VLHTSTSHGPTYYSKYPAEFEHFTPVCTTVEMAKADRAELLNAYDNTILYTDFLVNSTIEILKNITDRRSCMIFISDHGESLGENNLYMHGVPMALAPKEQVEIPFIVWSSDKTVSVADIEDAGQYHIFHSVLDFLDIESEIYNPAMTIFE
jgi:lipid A ethanolaminephosphotransferase